MNDGSKITDDKVLTEIARDISREMIAGIVADAKCYAEWLTRITEVGCFRVSGEKRSHVIPKPDCPACMATRALAGDPAPKKESRA